MVSARLTFLAIAASSLFSGALAHPHGRHVNKHAARDAVVEYIPARIEKHIVCDQFGNTLAVSYTTVYPATTSTSTSKRRRRPKKTTTTSVVEAIPTVYEPAPVVPEPVPATTTAAPVVEQPPAQSSSAPVVYPATSDNTDTANLGKGLVYSPYNSDHSCKSEAGVYSEMKQAFQNGDGYKWVRIYGADCNQVYNVMVAAYDLGIKVMLGIYNVEDGGAFNDELGKLKDQVKRANAKKGKDEKDWSIVALVSVGNELVNNRGAGVLGSLMGYVSTARTSLRECGYTGSVGTSDVWFRYVEHPALCGDDEIVPINMHPFFDQGCSIDGAGKFLTDKLAEVQAACGSNKKVIIVETGWPSAGNKMNNAQPGKSEQASFLTQAQALGTYIILSAFNENWKSENTAAHVEKFWGIYGDPPAY